MRSGTAWLAALGLATLLAACASGGASPDGNTSWLRRCTTNGDCGSGGSACVSGVCRPGKTTVADAGGDASKLSGSGGSTGTGGGAGSGGRSGTGGTTPDAASGGSASQDASSTTDARVDGATSDLASPSCAGLPADCGVNGDSSCCESLLVPGGTFYRSYDGVTSGYTSKAYPATVSDFRLDKYEITVARFRNFRAAWNGGWRPVAGAGKHTSVNGGKGLTNGEAPGYESGWDPAWTSSVAPTDLNLTYPCGYNGITSYATWTPAAGANDDRPINCVNWWETYAFCIWDGGFLPSEAEWNYAAAGGAEQREYPWGAIAPGKDAELAAYGCYFDRGDAGSCTGLQNLAPVGSLPAGNGRYGQSDLAGNVLEWNLDWYLTPYKTPCNDCSMVTRVMGDAAPPPYPVREVRGGSFTSDDVDPATALLASVRTTFLFDGDAPSDRDHRIGARCARAP